MIHQPQKKVGETLAHIAMLNSQWFGMVGVRIFEGGADMMPRKSRWRTGTGCTLVPTTSISKTRFGRKWVSGYGYCSGRRAWCGQVVEWWTRIAAAKAKEIKGSHHGLNDHILHKKKSLVDIQGEFERSHFILLVENRRWQDIQWMGIVTELMF